MKICFFSRESWKFESGGMDGLPLLARFCLDEYRLQELLQFFLEGVPRRVDAVETLASCDDDAATGKNEHDDRGIL